MVSPEFGFANQVEHKCCEANKEIWSNYPKEVAQKKTEKTKRAHKYYANILVVDDPAEPKNNGKVFLFEYGQKIQAMLEEANKPISARQKAIDPWDLFGGANFLIIAKTVQKQRNYDSSKFEPVSSISDDDERLSEIIASQYSLESLVDAKNFKSYDELKNIYEKVNGRHGTTVRCESETELEQETPEYDPSLDESDSKSKLSALDDLDDLPF